MIGSKFSILFIDFNIPPGILIALFTQVKDDFIEMLRSGDVRINPESIWSKKKKYFAHDDRFVVLYTGYDHQLNILHNLSMPC